MSTTPPLGTLKMVVSSPSLDLEAAPSSRAARRATRLLPLATGAEPPQDAALATEEVPPPASQL